MITKGIIKTLDYNGNTCTVHMPLFETPGNDPIIETATISNTPGSYNGYKVGDVVWVAFEDGSMSSPVVIGKLYLGAEAEKADPRGVLNVENSSVAKTATMPADTKLSAELDSNVPNTTVPFSSLSSIANNLNTLNTTVAQNDRDYGNRFKQVITNADGIKSTLEQTAANIRAEVQSTKETLEGTISDTKAELLIEDGKISTRVEEVNTSLDGKITNANSRIDQNANSIKLVVEETIPAINGTLETHSANIATNADNITAEVNARTEAVSGLSTELNSKITQNATDISAKVSKTQGDSSSAFGWTLNDTEWKIFNESKDILVADKDGLSVIGNITANSLTIKSGKSIEDELLATKSAAETAADTNMINKFDIVEIADGKIEANKLVVKSAQISDLVTDQLEVLTTDSEGNKHPILLVNAAVDNTGKTVRSEGNVQISGFEVHSSNLNNITDEGYISIGTNGIVLGKSEDSEEPPFMVKANGELTAAKGTFNGSITASEAVLNNTRAFSMSTEEDSEATFNKIFANSSISTASDITSLGGYFFGTDNSCGFKLTGTSTIVQEVELKISTIAPTIVETTNSSYCYYAIIVYLVKKGTTTRVNAANDIQVTYTGATWSNDLTTVTIPGKTVTIKAGSSSYTDGKTVANMSNFSDLKYELMQTYELGTRAVVGGGGLSGLKMPTGTPSSRPSITTPSNLIFTQNVISNANNIELNCNTFKMNGAITVPSTGAFYVKNSSNVNVVTLNSNGLQTDGAVKFKVNNKYYEPAVRLDEPGSPNCFWSCEKAFTENTAKSWIHVSYPSELIGKIVSVVAMARYPAWVPKGGKNSDGELVESDPTVDNRFYVDWSDTTNEIYAYNGTSYKSGGSLSIFVAAKI